MVLENTGIRYNAKKIRIEVDCPDAIEVYADAERLKQVLINLLDNTVKFTAQSGKISIMVSECKEEVVIRVKDNGQGIPHEQLPFIFEQFYRGDKSRHELTGGAGLGLNTVKMMVEAHGGRIEAFSVYDVWPFYEYFIDVYDILKKTEN